MPDSSDGPTVLRILLGTYLRRLRETKGITAREAAAAIRASESKISRIELGRNAIREIDVLDLLTLYGVSPADREQLRWAAEQANRPGWWHRYNDILPDWFHAYVGMEEAARSIRIYEPQFIPGLLQTEDIGTWRSATSPSRTGSARRPAQGAPVPVPGGAAAAMGAHRRGGAAPPGRRYRYPARPVAVPAGGVRHPGADPPGQSTRRRRLRPGGFSVLRFADHDLTDVVYVENLTSALYLDKRVEVDRYVLAMEQQSPRGARPAADARDHRPDHQGTGGSTR